MSEMVPPFEGGRQHGEQRRVRLGDIGIDGLARLDAIARYLQDVASDDSRTAEFDGTGGVWVVRRTIMEIPSRPRLEEELELTTFLGGIGGRWAERRTTVQGSRGGAVEAAALWVYVDRETAFPKPVPPGFAEVWGNAGGRKVSGRLTHGDPPDGEEPVRWAVRQTDYDTLGHMNNAAYWEVVEEELARRELIGCPGRFELEYRAPVEPHHDVGVIVREAGDGGALDLWIVGDGTVHATARARPSSRGAD